MHARVCLSGVQTVLLKCSHAPILVLEEPLRGLPIAILYASVFPVPGSHRQTLNMLHGSSWCSLTWNRHRGPIKHDVTVKAPSSRNSGWVFTDPAIASNHVRMEEGIDSEGNGTLRASFITSFILEIGISG